MHTMLGWLRSCEVRKSLLVARHFVMSMVLLACCCRAS
jgi:hypothetical protein